MQSSPTDPIPPHSKRLAREKRRHRLENLGLLVLAIGVLVLVFVAVAAGSR